MDIPVIQNHDAERFVLSAMLQNESTLVDALSRLTPAHFTDDLHCAVFRAMLKLVKNGSVVDVVTVPEIMGDYSEAAFMDLATASTTGICDAEIKILIDKHNRRDAYHIASVICQEIATAPDFTNIISQTQNRLALLGVTEEYDDTAKSMADNVFSDIVAIQDGVMPKVPSVPTGMFDLDNIIGGFYPGQLIVIAGRPSQGKSAFSLQLAWGAASRGYRTYYSSLEMSRKEIGWRLNSQVSGVPLLPLKLHGRQLDSAQAALVWKGSKLISDCNALSVSDQRGLSVSHYRAILQRAKLEGNPYELMVIDYLTKLKLNSAENQNLRIGNTTAELHDLAGQYNIPIIVLSQMKRGDGHALRRPQLSDLRDSGTIEEYADVVVFVFQDIEEAQDPHRGPELNRRSMVIDVAKNRAGATGCLLQVFDRPVQKFYAKDNQ